MDFKITHITTIYDDVTGDMITATLQDGKTININVQVVLPEVPLDEEKETLEQGLIRSALNTAIIDKLKLLHNSL